MVFIKNANRNPRVSFAKLRETNLLWIGFIKFLCIFIRNTDLFRMSEASYDLFNVFWYDVFILEFSKYPADQKNQIGMKNKEKGFVERRRVLPLKCPPFSYCQSSISLPFRVQPEGTWFSLCCVQHLHLAAANWQRIFFVNGQGIRSAERRCPDSAKAAVFLCIWLCCHIIRQECTQINCFAVYLKAVIFNTLLSFFHDTFTSSV